MSGRGGARSTTWQKKEPTVSKGVRLPADLVAEIERQAQAAELTYSQWIERAAREKIARDDERRSEE